MKCFDHTDKDDKCTEDQLQHGALNQSGFIAAAGLQKSENTIYKAVPYIVQFITKRNYLSRPQQEPERQWQYCTKQPVKHYVKR